MVLVAPDLRNSEAGATVVRKERDPYELVCQAPKTGGRSDRIHGARLTRVFVRVRPTGRLLKDLKEKARGCVAAWCTDCKVASEYEIVDAE